MNSDRFAHDDAAYVLGALGPAQRRAFEAHLSECASCAQSVRELAGIPGLLAGINPALFDDDVATTPVPEALLPRLMREVRRRRRRTRLLAAAGAAAAAVLVAVVATLVLGGRPAQEPTVAPLGPSQTMTQVDQDRLTASVSWESVAWGTRLRLSCRYSGGYDPPDASYALVVRTWGGGEEQVATWRALPDRTATLDAATAADLDDIAALDVVVTGTGRRLLSLDVTSG